MDKQITNEFLDMFLQRCGFGDHEFQFLFGDGRKEAVTCIRRSATEWPHTFMDQSFLSAFKMLENWLAGGRISFLTVRSRREEPQMGFMVEEIRCWSLTPLGAVPYSRTEAAGKFGVLHTHSVWNLDQACEERYCDAWDAELQFD